MGPVGPIVDRGSSRSQEILFLFYMAPLTLRCKISINNPPNNTKKEAVS